MTSSLMVVVLRVIEGDSRDGVDLSTYIVLGVFLKIMGGRKTRLVIWTK